jgi:hypothetical protein
MNQSRVMTQLANMRAAPRCGAKTRAWGEELKLDLFMAFVGAWDMWEIPNILEDHG